MWYGVVAVTTFTRGSRLRDSGLLRAASLLSTVATFSHVDGEPPLTA